VCSAIVILRRVPLANASLHRPICAINLATLSALLFREYRQEDDPPSCRDVVRDPLAPSAKLVKAELTQLSPQLSCVRLTEVDALLDQQVDVNAT
jgi:hypothetical protein